MVDHKLSKTRYNVTRSNRKFLKREYVLGTTFQKAYQQVYHYGPAQTPAGKKIKLALALGGNHTVTIGAKRFRPFRAAATGISNLIAGEGGKAWWEGEQRRIEALLAQRSAWPRR